MEDKMKKILVINGANLNLTGKREPSVYGYDTLDSINKEISGRAEKLGLICDFFQSNFEGEIINKIHTALENYDGIIINAGAFSHYSYAIRDAITSVNKPAVEVHLSNLAARKEEFRHKSVLTEVCIGIIAGFGKTGYFLALEALNDKLK